MKHKDLSLEIKSVGEDGTFEGLLSVYGNVDLGSDLVEPGAFTKTIQENKGVVPMLWQHDQKSPIGQLELVDSAEGLRVKGRFELEVQQAREAYVLVKSGIIKGLSIGYVAVKSVAIKGVRHLKELRLLEGSVVTFAMNPEAMITAVKAEQKADFNTELQNAQTCALQWIILDSLTASLRSLIWEAYYEGNLTRDEVIAQSMESIDQFRTAYGTHLPALLDLYNVKSLIEAERKAGRRLSDASRVKISEAITNLQALLGEEAASETASTSEPEAATKSTEPEALHSLVIDFTTKWKSQLAAA